MQDSGMGGDCANPTGDDGVVGADAICAARYSMDAGNGDDRNRIAEEARVGRISLKHKALLAAEDDNGGLPQAFDIRGKDSLPIRRPDETKIADSYSDFFTPTTPLRNAISMNDPANRYFTGMNDTFMLIPMGHCQNWTSPDSADEGRYGLANSKDSWLSSGQGGCDSATTPFSFHGILCITH